jgi:hypothetical protein
MKKLLMQPKIASKAVSAKTVLTPEQQELIHCNGARFKEPLLFIHTKKACNNGHPKDRLLLVIGYERVDPEKDGSLRDPITGRWIRSLYFRAWKCTITAEGIIHPEFHTRNDRGFCKHLPMTVHDVIKKGNILGKKAEPTAFFKPDSYYKQITPAELKAMVVDAARIKAATTPDPNIAIRARALAKLTDEEKKALGLK